MSELYKKSFHCGDVGYRNYYTFISNDPDILQYALGWSRTELVCVADMYSKKELDKDGKTRSVLTFTAFTINGEKMVEIDHGDFKTVFRDIINRTSFYYCVRELRRRMTEEYLNEYRQIKMNKLKGAN